MTMTAKTMLLPLGFAMLVAGCGGDSSQDGSGNPSAGLEGRVSIQGGLANATVFIDLPDQEGEFNGIPDEGEPQVVSDRDGYFSYNPNSRTNYCTSSDANHRQHCLRVTSGTDLPDEAYIHYFGGINLVTGEANDQQYRYRVDVAGLRNQKDSLDLDAAKAAITAMMDDEVEAEALVLGIIDAFYQYFSEEEEEEPAPFLLKMSTLASTEPSLQEKLQALQAAGLFKQIPEDVGSALSKLQQQLILMESIGYGVTESAVPPSSAVMYFEHQLAGLPGLPSTDMVERIVALLAQSMQGAKTGKTPAELLRDENSAENYLEAVRKAGLSVSEDRMMAQLLRLELDQRRQEQLQALQQLKDKMNEESERLKKISEEKTRLLETLTREIRQQQMEDSLTQLKRQKMSVAIEQLEEKIEQTIEAETGPAEMKKIKQALKVGTLAQKLEDFLNGDEAEALDLSDVLADFGDTLALLRENDIRLEKADVGKVLLSLSGDTGDGQLRACVQYQGNANGDLEQYFRDADVLYMTGTWKLLANNSSLLLSLNLMPGVSFQQVLQLDVEAIEEFGLNNVDFDLNGGTDEWMISTLTSDAGDWQAFNGLTATQASNRCKNLANW